MEKNRSTKIIAIVALLVAVVGVSLGFAAYNTSLTIQSGAEVSPGAENFKVVFLKDNTGVEAVTGVKVTPTKTPDTLTAADAEINGTTISGLSATFTARNQKVVYEFYVKNIGSYDAFLKSIVFNEVVTGKTRNCTTKVTGDTKNAEQAKVDLDCENITLTLTVGDSQATKDLTTSVSDITGRTLAQNASELVTVTIEYTAGDKINTAEDFTVEFGDINLNYSTSDTSN